MPDRTIGVTLTLTLDDADVAAVRATAAEDFGVELEPDATLADVIAAAVRNVVEANFVGLGMPCVVAGAKADETEG